jgi:integrase
MLFLTKVTFFKGKKFKLKTPIVVDLPEPKNDLERSLQQNVLESLMSTMSRLVPFVIESPAMMLLSRQVFLRYSGSQAVFFATTRTIYRFCNWANTTPDILINRCKNTDGSPNFPAIAEIERLIDEYAIYLQTKNIAPNTVVTFLRQINRFFRSNYVKLQLYARRPAMVIYECRAPTMEELRQIMNNSNLQEKLIVSILATSGIRCGTLCKLKYYHVKDDIEKNKVPVKINIEAEITKGKTHNYCTFLNQESTEYLNAYLQRRRTGTKYVAPEEINDQSPLIRARKIKNAVPPSNRQIQTTIHKLFFRSGVLTKKAGTTRYDFNVHSIRKFFRTQMHFLEVESKYVDYMMGHKIGDSYFDAQMKGPEYLRHIYLKSGISIRSEEKYNDAQLILIRDFIFRQGLNPEQVLNPQFNQLSEIV